MRARQRIEQRPQPGQPVPRGVLFSSARLHAQAQPRVGHEVAVIRVARPPRLLRVVPDLRALLVAIERLDGHVDVQHPRLAEHRFDARAQLACQPAQTLGFLNALERPAHHVLAHHARHAQERRIERVAAQRVDVRQGEALRAGQCPQRMESAAVPATLHASLPRLPW